MRALLTLALLLCLPVRAFALGNDALVYVGPTAITYTYDRLAFELGEAGAPEVVQTRDWPGGELADTYRLIVVTTYEGPLEPQVATDLATFVARGGGLVIVAEHDRGHDAGNAMAESVGVASRFEFGDSGGGCNVLDAAISNSLTAGADPLSFAWGTRTSGGELLYGEAFPLVTREGTVVLVGDSDVFADPVSLGGCPVGDPTLQFYRNLYTELPDESRDRPDAGPGGDDAGPGDAGGTDAGVPDMRAGLGDPCTSNAGCASGLCATLGDDMFCTQACARDDECGALVCDEAAALCLPRSGGGGGCASSGGAPAGSAALILLLGVMVRRARRR